ncbi:MAG: hypothetical protein HFJ34_01160 [Clostridia bacterium]|nr:hypothetical protein [Clostridia bacterium]
MKSKLTTIIITIIILLTLSVFSLFGIMVWNELKQMEISAQPEDMKTILSESMDTKSEEIKSPQILENPFDNIKDENQQREEKDNSNVNKYFYNQLEDYSKTIYRAFEINKENMKTGTQKIELGSSFSSLLQQEDGQEQLGNYYQSALEAYTYDNPDVFYLSPNKMYLNIETTTKGKKVTYYVYINSGDEENYLIDEFSSKEEVDLAINQIEQVKNGILQNRQNNAYDNIKMVHDYLVENIEYDTSISKNHIYNMYGAMINGEAVCEGYARSFKYLMDSLGIPCTLVIGKGTNSEGNLENHAWNYVQIDNQWYAIDTTWDDPVSLTGWVSQSSKYRYFLKGSNEMVKDHTPSGQFTEGGKMFYYPPLNSTNYE